MKTPSKISSEQLVKALLDLDQTLSPRFLYRLSDLSDDDVAAVKKAWPKIPAWRRQAIFEDLEEIGEDNYTLDYEAIARLGLDDEASQVRELALSILWEYEIPSLVPVYMDLMTSDPDANVRAEAAGALGHYVYMGEIDELPEETWHEIEDRLLDVTRGDDLPLVRRRALEALGFSSREDVPNLITTAYYSGDTEWLVSALLAMGRSASKEYDQLVIEMLDHDIPEVCNEAVRAAGELEIKKAVPRLLQLLETDDDEIRMSSVWSLSQIGGEGVQEALETLYDETEDDDVAEFIDNALENLAFTEDVHLFSLMDIDEDEDEDGDDYIEEDDEAA